MSGCNPVALQLCDRVFSLGLHERIPLAEGTGDWYRREGDVVWDVHSEVYIETTERTCVYKTEEKTPTSKEEPCLSFSGPVAITVYPLGDISRCGFVCNNCISSPITVY